MSQEKELTIVETEPGFGIEQRFNTVLLHLHSEEEAERMYIALVEADRKGSFVKISFDNALQNTTKNL